MLQRHTCPFGMPSRPAAWEQNGASAPWPWPTGLTNFDPAERWTVGRAMRCRLFDGFRQEAHDEGRRAAAHELEFMHYLHDEE